MPQQVKPTDKLPEGRMALVDALRGLAALWVAAYHFYNAIAERGQLSWFEPLKRVLEVGNLGVMVFFVLSGFVIACSVHRARVTGRYVGIFALRRSLRLDPTYWTVIWLTCLMALAKSSWTSATNPVAFTLGDVLLNMCYLNRLVQGPTIVAVGWTLCLEVQFYLVFVATCWVGQAVLRRATTVAPVRVLRSRHGLFTSRALRSLAGASSRLVCSVLVPFHAWDRILVRPIGGNLARVARLDVWGGGRTIGLGFFDRGGNGSRVLFDRTV